MCTIVYFLVDIAYAFIDPRIKSTYGFGVKKAKIKAEPAKAVEGGKV
jgi:hypothetical protein